MKLFDITLIIYIGGQCTYLKAFNSGATDYLACMLYYQGIVSKTITGPEYNDLLYI